MRQLLALFFTLTLSLPTLAQKLEIGVGYGYNHITSPEQYVRSVSNLGYGFTESNPILATIRLSKPDSPVSFSLSTVYQKLTGRGTQLVYYVTNSNLLPGEIENESSLWSVAFGTDWTILKSDRSPYLSLELLYSSMGDLLMTMGTPEGNRQHLKTGSIQAGLAFGGGFNFPLVLGAALRLDAKYISYGLFGHPTGENSVNSAQLSGTFIIPIWTGQPG